MRAAVIEAAGAPPRCVEQPRPTADPDRMTIAVRAAPITPLDKLCAGGTSYFGRPATPYVPGVQGVGTVERGTGAIPAGTLVWFATAAGMAAGRRQHARGGHRGRTRRGAAARPDADPVLVAGLGLSAVAAWMALTWRGGLAAGEQVLVLGAGGVVGQSAIQLARLAGAGRVIAAARSAAARERAFGWARTRWSRCSGRRARRAGPAAARGLRRPRRPGARPAVRGAGRGRGCARCAPAAGWSTWAARPRETAPLESAVIRSKHLHVLGYTNNELSPQQRREALVLVAEHAAAGRLTVEHAGRAAGRGDRGLDPRRRRPRRPHPLIGAA